MPQGQGGYCPELPFALTLEHSSASSGSGDISLIKTDAPVVGVGIVLHFPLGPFTAMLGCESINGLWEYRFYVK